MICSPTAATAPAIFTPEAAKIAADCTVECITFTGTLDNHWYGEAFEPVLGKLIDMLK